MAGEMPCEIFFSFFCHNFVYCRSVSLKMTIIVASIRVTVMDDFEWWPDQSSFKSCLKVSFVCLVCLPTPSIVLSEGLSPIGSHISAGECDAIAIAVPLCDHLAPLELWFRSPRYPQGSPSESTFSFSIQFVSGTMLLIRWDVTKEIMRCKYGRYARNSLAGRCR